MPMAAAVLQDCPNFGLHRTDSLGRLRLPRSRAKVRSLSAAGHEGVSAKHLLAQSALLLAEVDASAVRFSQTLPWDRSSRPAAKVKAEEVSIAAPSASQAAAVNYSASCSATPPASLDEPVAHLLARREQCSEKERTFNVWRFRPSRMLDNSVPKHT